MRLAFLALTLATTPALADTHPAGTEVTPQLAAKAQAEPRVAIAVNSPIGWYEATSLGASLYVRTVGDHAVRVNVARYEGHVLDLGESTHAGKTTDLGVGWVAYSQGPFSGLMLEVGALYRTTNEHEVGPFWDAKDTDTKTIGGRAMIGYSFRLHRHFFIAAAAGVSLGKETGTETTWDDNVSDPMKTITQVDRVTAAPEGYLRFGVPF